MTVLVTLATIAGTATALSVVAQVVKIFTRKSAKDISIITYIITGFGSIIWILYGLEIKSLPIILANVIGIVTSSLILIGYYLYGNE